MEVDIKFLDEGLGESIKKEVVEAMREAGAAKYKELKEGKAPETNSEQPIYERGF